MLFENDFCMVFNKPSGLSVQGGEGVKVSLDSILSEQYTPRPLLVHRLDRDTSGLMLFAKNENTKRALQDNWADILLSRGYTAVVEGCPAARRGTVTSWLKETKTHLMYSSGIKGDGQQAVTNYRVVESSGGFSILDIRIETGRKNQIRVHMKDIGHSIVGDRQYGTAKRTQNRLFLHAHLLEFKHPETGVVLRFETEIPKQFTALLKRN